MSTCCQNDGNWASVRPLLIMNINSNLYERADDRPAAAGQDGAAEEARSGDVTFESPAYRVGSASFPKV